MRVASCKEVDRKRAYKLYMKLIFMLNDANMAAVRIFENISFKFNIVGICTRKKII